MEKKGKEGKEGRERAATGKLLSSYRTLGCPNSRGCGSFRAPLPSLVLQLVGPVLTVATGLGEGGGGGTGIIMAQS